MRYVASMPKHSKKHVRRFHRGKPTKPKTAPRTELGRPRLHPVDANRTTMVRSTDGERMLWESASRYETQMLNLPHGSELSLNGWILRALNDRAAMIAAHANGVTVDSKRVEAIESALRE